MLHPWTDICNSCSYVYWKGGYWATGYGLSQRMVPDFSLFSKENRILQLSSDATICSDGDRVQLGSQKKKKSRRNGQAGRQQQWEIQGEVWPIKKSPPWKNEHVLFHSIQVLKSLPLTPNFHLYKELQGQKKKEDLWEAGGIQHHQKHKETK